jgi:hypothetical protein
MLSSQIPLALPIQVSIVYKWQQIVSVAHNLLLQNHSNTFLQKQVLDFQSKQQHPLPTTLLMATLPNFHPLPRPLWDSHSHPTEIARHSYPSIQKTLFAFQQEST